MDFTDLFTDTIVNVVVLLTIWIPGICAQLSSTSPGTSVLLPSFSYVNNLAASTVTLTSKRTPSLSQTVELSTSSLPSQYVDLTRLSISSEVYRSSAPTGDSESVISSIFSSSHLGSSYGESLPVSVSDTHLPITDLVSSDLLETTHLTLDTTHLTLETTNLTLDTSHLTLESTHRPLISVVPTTTVVRASSHLPELEGMNTSTSTVSPHRTSPANNDTLTKSTLSGIVSGTTATTPSGFGNVSCSGNNTGCPEYNGREALTLSTPAIIGIAVGAAVFVIVVVCLLLCLCRRRRSLSGSKADLSAYWDDNVTLSYINGHLDYPKDVSDEMVSLDNDSFLNSLDSMSFSNVWAAESAKHTNF